MSIRLPQIELGILAVVFGTKLGVVLWGLDRGLDPGDDGVFLLSFNYPETAPPLFAFYKLLTLLPSPLQLDWLGARLLRLVTELLALLALAGGVSSWARARLFDAHARELRPSRLRLVLFALMAALLTAGARAFSYNDLTNLCSYAATGLFFYLAGRESSFLALPRTALLCGFMGALVGVQLFVKFPPALLLGLALPLLLLASIPKSERVPRTRLLLAFQFGGLSVLPLFVLAHGGIHGLRESYAYALEINRLTGYDVSGILGRYLVNDLAAHVNLLGFTLLFGLVYGLVHALWARRSPTRRDVALALAWCAAAVVLCVSVQVLRPEFVNSSLLFLYCSVISMALLAGLLFLRSLPIEAAAGSGRRRFLPLLILFVLPFANVLGSNVALTLRLPAHVAPLFFLIALLLHELRLRGLRVFYAACLCTLMAATSVAFLRQQLLQPYGLPAALYEQRLPVPSGARLRVDAGTRDFLARLSQELAAAGFEAGDPVIALDYTAGLVHYLGATSPGFPFFARGRSELNCFLANRFHRARKPFLLLAEPMSEAQRSCFEAFRFPEDFVFLAALPNPYRRAYEVFFDAPDSPELLLYAPRP